MWRNQSGDRSFVTPLSPPPNPRPTPSARRNLGNNRGDWVEAVCKQQHFAPGGLADAAYSWDHLSLPFY
ncbi:hypothetical protein EYF80_022796 [Liparis tanakae]|uniref:Uncharacterized protein n=1 Tax=Liparis tanakae TaxID=230148 RepID=A0A4Z2HPV6_9TELE|nr:hypothetical protein EYF80_022796 [Liparis tanakae]